MSIREKYPPLHAVPGPPPGIQDHPSNGLYSYANSLLSKFDEPVLLADSRDVVRLANGAALALLDCLAERAIGEPLAEVTPRWLSRHDGCAHSSLQSDIGNDYVMKLVRANGTSSCVGLTLDRQVDAQLGPITLVFMRDLADGYTDEGLTVARRSE